MAAITAVKKFKAQGPGINIKKLFPFVINNLEK
jgi:hypothetical protein